VPRPHPDHGTRSKYVLGCRCHKCAKANRQYLDERKQRQGHTPTNIPKNQTYHASTYLRWPAEPLHRIEPNHTAEQWAELAGCDPRNWWRWTHDGIPDHASDRIAIGIGYHPAQIWPDWLHKAEQLIATNRRIRRRKAA
jgi:hypothetical protein